MTKIAVTNNQSFTAAQKQRLDSLGDVTYFDSLPKDAEEYLERVNGADIICSGTAGLQNAYPMLKDVYITVGFVSVATEYGFDEQSTSDTILLSSLLFLVTSPIWIHILR